MVDLAIDFRQRFHRDAIIELWCYRKLRAQRGRRAVVHAAGHVPDDRRQAVDPRWRTWRTTRANPTPGGEAQITVEETDAIAARKRHELEAELEVATQGEVAAAAEHVRGRLVAHQGRRRTPACPRSRRRRRRPRSSEVTRALSTRARGLPRAPQAEERSSSTARAAMARRRKADRLGHGRGAGVRDAAGGGDARASVRAGLAPRHVQPPPLRAARLQRRPRVHAARAHPRKAGDVRGARQPAVGGRRARLRVRLQPGHARRADDLGGAVRRLRERGAGDHRSVPRARRRRSGTA